MAHKASWSFESNTVEGWVAVSGGAPAASSTQKRTGGYSLGVTAGSVIVAQIGANLTTGYLGLGNYQENWRDGLYFGFRKSGVVVARLQFNSEGKPTLYYQGGSASVSNEDFIYTLNAMHYFEMFAEIGSSADIICKVDGDIIISLLNADTRASGGTITDVAEVVVQNPFTAGCYIDDVWVDDANWPDGIKLAPYDVDSDGTHGDWDASGADPKYQYVDGVPPSSSDYIQTATGNEKQSFGIESVTGLGANVEFVGVQVVHHSYEPNGVSSKTLDPFIRVDGADYQDGVDHTLTSDVQFYQGAMHETNPDTGLAWTDTELSGIEIGLKSSA